MSPKEILVLLEIIDKAAQSTAYSHITAAAHAALAKAQLTVLADPTPGGPGQPVPPPNETEASVPEVKKPPKEK